MMLRQGPSGRRFAGDAAGEIVLWDASDADPTPGFPIVTIPFPSYYQAEPGAFADPGFLGPYTQTVGPLEPARQIPASRACTLKNLFLSLNSGVVGTADFIAVLRVNGVNTALAATVPVGESQASETSARVNVLVDDLISISIAGNGTDLPSNMIARFEIEYVSVVP